MKIICPYCHEENEIDINGGDSFICQSKNCNKKVMIAKVDNKSTYHWAIILLVLFIFISINAFRNNSALKNVNEELSKKLNSKTEELNKVASESQQLSSNIENYILAKKYMDEGKYKDAVSIFENIDSFMDSNAQKVICNNNIKYLNAINLLKDEKFDEAKDIFVSLGDFKDSKEQMKVCENNIEYNNAF